MPVGAVPFPFGACRICNDKATGVHYGVATCEGCKGFFKRSILRGDRYKCFFGDQCSISPQTRNRCKACRYRRCQEQGMALDAVKMGRIPKVEKEKALMMARMKSSRGTTNVESSNQGASNMDTSTDSSRDCMSPDSKQFESFDSEPQPETSNSQTPFSAQQSMETENGHNLQTACSASEFRKSSSYPLDAPILSSSCEEQPRRNESFLGGANQSHARWMSEPAEQPVFRDMDSHQLQTVPRGFSSPLDLTQIPPPAHSGGFSKSTSQQHPQPVSWQQSWPDNSAQQPRPSYAMHGESNHHAGSACLNTKPFQSPEKDLYFRQRQYSSGDMTAVACSANSFHRQSTALPQTSQAFCLYSQGGAGASMQHPSRDQPLTHSGDLDSSSLQGSVYSSNVLKVLYDQVVKQSSEDQLLEKLADTCSSSSPAVLNSSFELLHSLAPAPGNSSSCSLSELSAATTQSSPVPHSSTDIQHCGPGVSYSTPTHSQVTPATTQGFLQQPSSFWSPGDGTGSVADQQQDRSSSDGEDSGGGTETAIKDFSRRLAQMVTRDTYSPTSASDVKLFDACFGLGQGTPAKNCIEEHAEFLKQKPRLPVLDDVTLDEFLKTERLPDDNPSLNDLCLDSSPREDEKSDLPHQWCASEAMPAKPEESKVVAGSSAPSMTNSDAKTQNGFGFEIKTEPGFDQTLSSCFEESVAGGSNACNGSKLDSSNDDDMDAQDEPFGTAVLPTSAKARVVLTKSFERRFSHVLQGKQELLQFLAEHPTDPYMKEVPGELTSDDMKELWASLTESLNDWNVRIIGFCKEVPGFQSLDATDQSHLLKRAYYDIWMIMSSPFFLHNKSYLKFPNGRIYKKWVMEKIISKTMVNHLFKFAEQFGALHLNNTAVAILCAIQLTAANHDSSDFVNVEAIQQLNSTYLDHLVEEVSSSHPHICSRILVDIFRLIPLLIDINKLQSQLASHYILNDPKETKNQDES